MCLKAFAYKMEPKKWPKQAAFYTFLTGFGWMLGKETMHLWGIDKQSYLGLNA